LNLRPHQVEGVEWLRSHGRGLLADSPRSGKTAQLLTAAEGETLVVAPPFLESTWLEQHALWRPDLDMTFVGYASVAKRVPNAQGHLRNTIPAPKSELAKHWDTLICDESHSLINRKANWTQAVAKIKSDRLFLATGTPIAHWAQDLLMTLRLLYPGDRRFTNYQNWINRWFDVWLPPWGGIKIGDLKPELSWEEFWFENGMDGPDGRMLQREVDLGVPYTEQSIEVEMTPSQAKFYKKLKADYLAALPDGGEVGAWSDGGLHTKLAQASTGLACLGDGGPVLPGSAKLQVVRDLLPESRRSPTLVFCHFRETGQLIHNIATDLGLRSGLIRGGVAGADRDDIRRRFQNGELDVMVGTLATVAVGLEFSRASTEIFVEHSWTPWKNDQALKRAMVIGKKSHVHVVHLWTKKTVDTGMRSLIGDKTEQQIKALSAREFRETLDG